jgi:BirA family biotin operon repressor/biotin-[acetyl-CoA-carboxylase] ligase
VPHRGACVSTPWLLELDACDSTNTWALAHLSDLAHGTAVYTKRQTAGRGQHGRRWLSPTGVLTVSYVLDLGEPTAGAQLSLAAGLAVAHTVDDLAPGAHATIKWPNDCYCRDRKLAGLLCEARLHKGKLRCVAGIGLNIAAEWTGDEEFGPLLVRPPIDLRELGRNDPDPMPVLTSLRNYLLEAIGLLRAGRWQGLLDQLRTRDHLLGRPLRVERLETRGGTSSLAGTGAGIDDEGRLLLALGDGGMIALDAGTVYLQSDDTSTASTDKAD